MGRLCEHCWASRIAGQCLFISSDCISLSALVLLLCCVRSCALGLSFDILACEFAFGSVLECIVFVDVFVVVLVWRPLVLLAGMFRGVFCFVSLACGQTFPSGVGELLSQLRSKLGDVDGMRVDNSGVLQELSKAGADGAAAAESSSPQPFLLAVVIAINFVLSSSA